MWRLPAWGPADDFFADRASDRAYEEHPRMATARKSPKPATKRKRRGVSIEPVALPASDIALAEPEGTALELARQVVRDGGSVIGSYRDPLGGHAQLMVALPIEKVAPTPYQRDVSDAHVRKLTRAMDKTKRFLDPLILVREGDRYLTPNGNHRLTAMTELGAHAIVGLLVPEAEVAYQILALNIEKAHNLRERALEVVRMYRALADSDRNEAACELEFEEAALITLGFAYEERGRLSGGAYHPALRKVDRFLDRPLRAAVAERERRAARVLELDAAVTEAVGRLKERGLTSPYLRSFVVARINPLRFIKGEPPEFDALLDTMTKRARGLKTDRIQVSDLARSGGAPDEE
jgi:ParB family chromosome partitioning protein